MRAYISRDATVSASATAPLQRIAGYVPPHDLDAEAAVLSALLLEDDALYRVADILKPVHFYSDANRRIYEAAIDLASSGTVIDIVTVHRWLRQRGRHLQVGGATYLAQIADATPAVVHLEHHALIVVETYLMRCAIAEAQRIAAEGYGQVHHVPTWLESIEQRIAAVARQESRNPAERVGTILHRVFQAISDAAARGQRITGVPTGFGRLDAKTSGMHPGDLWIVAARPGMGKTAFALAVAQNVTNTSADAMTEYAAIVVSLEMPREQLAVRLACAGARVDVNQFRQGQLSTEEWRRLTTSAAELAARPLWIEDGAGLTVLEIRARVRRMMAQWERPAQCEERKGPDGTTQVLLVERERKVGVVLIDYLQFIKGRPGLPREQEIAEVSRDLKALAKDLKVPVVALSALNRSVESRADKRPQLSDLRESGAIEQDADTVMFIYRDEYYRPTETRFAGLAEITIAKQRNGPTGSLFLRYQSYCTRFDNLAPSDGSELH